MAEYSELLEKVSLKSGDENEASWQAMGTPALEQAQTAAKVLRRPQVTFLDLLGLMDAADRQRFSGITPDIVEQLDLQARYEGYIRRQLADIKRHRATETMAIAPDIEYSVMTGLTHEAKDKLGRIRPSTVGQASRIPGVSPADISLLLVHLHRHAAR